MKRSLLNYLVCPDNGGPLELQVTAEQGGEIRTGLLRSTSGETYRIDNFVPRFVATDAYASTFSRQRELVRRHFRQYAQTFDEQENDDLFVRSTGFDLGELDGLTLDAGCGYGRFLNVVDRADGEVIGVDMSAETVDLAYEFVGARKNVHIVQADLFRLPFRKGSFQRVFSIGVLHHTPSTRAAFEGLLPYVSPAGEIAIWVYSPSQKATSDRWRKVTTRLPLNAVYAWCVLNESLLAPFRSLPLGGGFVGKIFPGGVLGTPFWPRVMSDFDDLTPRFAFSHGAEEVAGWFRSSGLCEIEVLARSTAVRGRKSPPTDVGAERIAAR